MEAPKRKTPSAREPRLAVQPTRSRPRAKTSGTAFSPDFLLEQRKSAMLRAAAAAFNRKGFANTMMEDIASALGVSKPTLYRYFKSKDDVLFECHRLAMHYAELALQKAKDQPT